MCKVLLRFKQVGTRTGNVCCLYLNLDQGCGFETVSLFTLCKGFLYLFYSMNHWLNHFDFLKVKHCFFVFVCAVLYFLPFFTKTCYELFHGGPKKYISV